MTFGSVSGDASRQSVSLALYALIVAGLVSVGLALGSRAAAGGDEATALADELAALQSRAASRPAPPPADVAQTSGSPFLEGDTITVAGAAFQQRLERAAEKAGGHMTSTQVELDGADAADRRVRISAALDIDAAGVQPLLYDLEAGMPYIFVDLLDLRAPDAGAEATGKLKLTLGVSAKWEAAQ